VFFADRSDISEELTRAAQPSRSILCQLAKDEPVGRTLDFLLQEMFRETNTIGNKANFLAISQIVVGMKNRIGKTARGKCRILNESSVFRRQEFVCHLGASGTGKSTLCANLRATPDFIYSISCTTRQPRPGEENGVDYHFLAKEKFEALIASGDMLEYATVHGNYLRHAEGGP